MGKQACTISRMVPTNKEASPLTVKPQPPARVLAHDMHGQCLSSDQARVGTRGLANHVGVLAVSLSLNLSLSPSLDLSLSLNLPLKTKTPASR